MMKKIGYKLCTVYIVSFILIFVHFQIGIPVNWFVMMSIVNSNKKNTNVHSHYNKSLD